ncbi:MAG: hypothetical protein ACK41C_02295 [Phenylobacterium sp.]|uniref:hypothetical protein n=1 Tax=Phenylobacterium sp. TaxID=1871053 RepID=UPI00391B991C
MSLYVFYPTRPNGVSLTFCAVDLENDRAAGDYAEGLLIEYPACVSVAGWRGERKALLTRRDGPPLALPASAGTTTH